MPPYSTAMIIIILYYYNYRNYNYNHDYITIVIYINTYKFTYYTSIYGKYKLKLLKFNVFKLNRGYSLSRATTGNFTIYYFILLYII